MTTEAIKAKNIQLSTVLASTEAEKNRLTGIIADKSAEAKKWCEMCDQLCKDKMVAPQDATAAEMQRVTSVLASTETEKNRLAGIIAVKDTEVKRWYDLYTQLFAEKIGAPQNAPAAEMERLTAVLAGTEEEKNRLAGLIPAKDAEVKRWYDTYNKIHEQSTVTPDNLSAAEVQRLTAILADTEEEKNRLAGLIPAKDVEVKRWYDMYNALQKGTNTAQKSGRIYSGEENQ